MVVTNSNLEDVGNDLLLIAHCARRNVSDHILRLPALSQFHYVYTSYDWHRVTTDIQDFNVGY